MPSKEILSVESALERLPYGKDASPKLGAIIEELDHFQGLSGQAIDDLDDTLDKVDDLRFKVIKPTFLLNVINQKLANLETKMTVLGDTQANIEQDMEQLSARKDQSPMRLACSPRDKDWSGVISHGGACGGPNKRPVLIFIFFFVVFHFI